MCDIVPHKIMSCMYLIFACLHLKNIYFYSMFYIMNALWQKESEIAMVELWNGMKKMQ